MLIHVDSSAAADAASESATSARSRACIENLLLAHFEGNHVISLLPGDAAALRLVASPWSARAQRALEHIDENYAQVAGLREDISWSLELGLGPSFDGKAYGAASGRNVLRAPLPHFERFHTASRSLLLGENKTDAELFFELGMMRRADLGWEGVEIGHEIRGAGGSTLAPEYKQLADQGRILLAIADSDRRHDRGGFGGTYSKLAAEAQARPAYQRARPLHTRTGEGLVPISVYREAFRFPHEHGDHRLGGVARLEQLLRSARSDILLYADLKNGITLHHVEHAENSDEHDYWSDVAKAARRDQCTRSTADQCTKREECRCYVVDSLGDKALADVVTWMKTRASKKDLASRFGLSKNPDLTALADEVLAWGLALSPLLT